MPGDGPARRLAQAPGEIRNHVVFHADQLAAGVAHAPGRKIGLDADNDLAPGNDVVERILEIRAADRRC